MKRKRKIRTKMKGTKTRPRLSVFRSNQAIYAQIINDETGKTLVAASEKEIPGLAESASWRTRAGKLPKGRATKTNRAKLLGEALAKKALKRRVKAVFFDRRKYKYHGRVKALAEGARKGGLVF